MGCKGRKTGKKGEAAGAGLEAAQSLKYLVMIDGVRMEISCFQGPSAGFTQPPVAEICTADLQLPRQRCWLAAAALRVRMLCPLCFLCVLKLLLISGEEAF